MLLFEESSYCYQSTTTVKVCQHHTLELAQQQALSCGVYSWMKVVIAYQMDLQIALQHPIPWEPWRIFFEFVSFL
jgi:hypothetical protein